MKSLVYEVTEEQMYEVVIMYGENGEYFSKVHSKWENLEQAVDTASELRACGYSVFVR